MSRFRSLILVVLFTLLASPLSAQRICAPLMITIQPQSQSITLGQSAILSVSINKVSEFPVTYRWYRGVSGDTTNLVSETVSTSSDSDTITVSPTTTTDYWVQITDSCLVTPAVVNSNTATITVCVPPAITTQPQNTFVEPGQSATFTVGASGSSPLSYQWYRGMAPDTSTPVGTNSPSYTTEPLSSNASVWVRVTNSCGFDDSTTVTATICTPPSIVAQPSSESTFIGSPTSISVTAAGSEPLTYEWFQGFSPDTSTPAPNAGNSPTFTTLPLSQNTQFWVRVSNACGFVNSETIPVFVFGRCVPPSITSQPAATIVNPGASATFSVTASGSPAFSYQWFRGSPPNTSDPIGINSNVLTLSAVNNTTTVWVRVSNECGTVDSASATVTLNCVPLPAPVPALAAETLSGIPYALSWNPVTSAITYEVQESPTPDFSGATTLSTSANSLIFSHSTGSSPSPFYYRVRAVGSCAGSASAYSPTVAIVVQPTTDPNPVLPTGVQFAIPEGTQANVNYTFLYVPPAEFVGATFAATTDVPWMTVAPSSGTALAAGINFTVTVDALILPAGTNFGTIDITFASTKRESVRSNHNSPSIPVAVSVVTPVSPVARNTPQENSLILPAVAHVGGVGAEFVSDVRINNTATQTLRYLLRFTPSGIDPTANLKQSTITIEPGRTMALNDIVKQWFGFGSLGDGTKGMLEIRPENYAGKVVVDARIPFTTVASSRTYARTSAGTFGQFVPAIPFSRFISGASGASNPRISLQHIAQSPAFRTNLGLLEAAGQPVVLNISVFTAAGQKIGDFSEPLRAGEHKQLDQYLASKGIELSDGRIEVAVTSGSGRVTAYASVLDNTTSDPMLVAPVRLFAETTTHLVTAGVADINTGTALWRTDVRLFNPDTSTMPVTLRFYPQGSTSPVTRQTSVLPGEVRVLDNLLQTLFGISGATGALHIETATSSPLVVTARTYDQQVTGTFGQFIPAVSASDGVGLGERPLNVLQLEQSDPYRTNLGLAELTGQPVTVELNLIIPTSTSGSVLRVNLGPNEFRQLNSIMTLMGAPTGYNARLVVRVISGSGRVFAYGSNIDNLTQDPTYVPGQ